MRRIAWALLGAVFVASAEAQTPVSPAQNSNTQNVAVTSGVASAVSVTFTPGSQTRVRLYSAAGWCSGGTAQLTVTEAGTTTWLSDPAFASTTTKSAAWIPPYTGAAGKVAGCRRAARLRFVV